MARKLKLMKNIGTSALDDAKIARFLALTTGMGETYSKAKVPDFETKKKQFSLEPELTERMMVSRNPKELQFYWEQWREASGKQMINSYKEYVDLYNEAAVINGFRDASKMKVDAYESDTFQEEMEQTWQGLKPLYEELHAYVRHKLNQHYGDQVVEDRGALPAHLLGNMWGQSWGNIADIVKPYPKKPSIDVTDAMVKQGWTQQIMFEKADDFFVSMGMTKVGYQRNCNDKTRFVYQVPKEFWEGSIIKKPDDGRELTCHASAWDFYNGKVETQDKRKIISFQLT